MPLQTAHLSMAALSVKGDNPPNSIQPKLEDGIHLRWAFEKSCGFPWYGYYLYRRMSNVVDQTLRRFDLSGIGLGTLPVKTLAQTNGEVQSDSLLVATNDFPHLGLAELDLVGRRYLRYIPSDLASTVRLEVGFRQDSEVTLTAFLEQTPVSSIKVNGQRGQVVSVEIKFEAISSVELSQAPAAVVSIGFLAVTVTDNPLAGWQPVPDFPIAGLPATAPYPLCLPVAHPDYNCPGAPATAVDAEKLALDRVRYKLPDVWVPASFADLHASLQALVVGGPSGKPMASKQMTVWPVPATAGLKMPDQSPLDLLLVGALHPGIAQMIGLAWVDKSVTASPTTSYDYLIVADHQGLLDGTWNGALQYLRMNGLGDVDAFIVYGKRLDDATAPLDPPMDVRAYSLPIHKTGPSSVASAGAAGLRWDRGVTATGVLLPGKPILYHVWRADLGAGTAPTAPTTYAHLTRNGPLLIADSLSGSAQATPPSDWPPFRLYFVDGSLAEGWYGYQVNGVDIFGRHSANGPSAQWYQWTPPPSPVPWYYTQPPGDTVVHPSAVALLDKTPPPPIVGVEAWALDPDDPLLVQDAAYTSWRATLAANEQDLIGLRVSWLWPQTHMDQATDTREFRIYFYVGRQNTLIGNTTAIAAASATESNVTTDIPNAQPANEYAGARLQIGNASFRILGSVAGTPLAVRVANIGVNNDVPPAAGAACSIVIPERTGTGSATRSHPLHIDYTAATNWQERYYVVRYSDHFKEVLETSTDSDDNLLFGGAVSASGAVITLFSNLPDLSGVGVVGSYLHLDNDNARSDKLYRIQEIDAAAHTVTIEAAPYLPTGSSTWKIVRKLRRYEVFFPVGGDPYRGGAPLSVSGANPVSYGSIGVSAVDDKQHTSDAAKWTSGRWGGPERFGNEGRVNAAQIYLVDRRKPSPPELPAYSDERIWSTRADYHSHSFFTFRWVAQANVKTHVLRALDDTLFKTDWLIRSTRRALDPANKTHEKLFPPSPAWTITQKQSAAAELNNISTQADYSALSADGRELLARLPGNEGLAWGIELRQRDWEIRRTRTALAASDAAIFPTDWNVANAANAQKRQDVATELNAIASAAAYGSLSNNAMRILASLPANEAAFTQLTIQPLDPDDPATADRRGPDSPDSYAPVSTLRAYVDTLDGRSANQYFYRALNVSEVHTRGDLGLATPPVICPDVVPPRAPAITKVFAGDPDPSAPGDRKITLRWASNREPDLREYRVYRADNEGAARDLRLMTLMYTNVRPFGDPATRPAEITWTDTAVQGLVTYYYRLVAVDSVGNKSEPSRVVAGRAFDDARPASPVWNTPLPGASLNEIVLSWTLTITDISCLVQRRLAGVDPWINISGWLARGAYTFTDTSRTPAVSYDYRLLVIDNHGRQNNAFNLLTI